MNRIGGKKERRQQKDRAMSQRIKHGPPSGAEESDTSKALSRAEWEARKEQGFAGLPGAGRGGIHKSPLDYKRKPKHPKNLEHYAREKANTLAQAGDPLPIAGGSPLRTRRDYGSPLSPKASIMTTRMSRHDYETALQEHLAKRADMLLDTEEFEASLHEGKFEEGVPADPTENMSESDAAEWWRQNEKNKDKFKGATVQLTMLDKRVIDAFLSRKSAEGTHLSTDGKRLMGQWKGGLRIAEWGGSTISFQGVGDKAAQIVRDAIARSAPRDLIKADHLATERAASEKFELVYSTGGHGGPYKGLDEAKEWAERLLKGGRDQWIAVIPARDITDLDKAVAVAILHRGKGWQTGKNWLPNVPANQRRASGLDAKAAHKLVLEVTDSLAEYLEERTGRGARRVISPENSIKKFQHDWASMPDATQAFSNLKADRAYFAAVSLNASLTGMVVQVKIGQKLKEFPFQAKSGQWKAIESAIEAFFGKVKNEGDKTAKFPRGVSMTVDEVAEVVGPEFKEMNENPPPEVLKVREEMQGKTAAYSAMDRLKLLSAFQVLSFGTAKAMGVSRKDALEAVWKITGKKLPSDAQPPTKKSVDEYLAWLEEQEQEATGKTAASGLYGFTKDAEKVCGTAASRLAKKAVKLAKEIYERDANVASFLEVHVARTGSKAAKMLRAAMADIGPGAPPKVASDKEAASKSGKGRYGFPIKTVKMAFDAISDLDQEAGIIASDVHARRTAKHAEVMGFLGKHSKKAKCGWSDMILEAYPDASVEKVASGLEAYSIHPSVEEIFAWDGVSTTARSAASFLASEDEEGDED